MQHKAVQSFQKKEGRIDSYFAFLGDKCKAAIAVAMSLGVLLLLLLLLLPASLGFEGIWLEK